MTCSSSLTETYQKKLQDHAVDEQGRYKSWKLKERLTSHYGDKLVFAKRPGLSDLVCSHMMPIGDAMKEASTLDKKEKDIQDPIASDVLHTDESLIIKSYTEHREL